MASKFSSRIPWREKLERQQAPKIMEIPTRMQKRLGKGTMVIPRPLDVDALISQSAERQARDSGSASRRTGQEIQGGCRLPLDHRNICEDRSGSCRRRTAKRTQAGDSLLEGADPRGQDQSQVTRRRRGTEEATCRRPPDRKDAREQSSHRKRLQESAAFRFSPAERTKTPV